MAKGRVYDPDWIIRDDEFHPNHGVAAKHADRLALEASRTYLGGQVKKLLTRDEPLTIHEARELAGMQQHISELNEAITAMDKEDE